MILRGYQEEAVAAGRQALQEHGNTLIVAPTGAGKTIMLSALIGRMNPSKALVLQHRDELVAQNSSKYRAVTCGQPSVVDANIKSWRGDAVFAMVQTLCRPANLDRMPSNIDLLVVDEAHHAIAPTYRKIIDRAKDNNPNIQIAGFTATPRRGDKKGLRKVFDNVAYQIAIKALIDQGFLVPPRAMIIDVGTQSDLRHVKRTALDYDMGEVAQIMNKRTINEEVVRKYREHAAGRKTVVFTSTVAHAVDVCDTFKAEGIPAAVVSGETPEGERRSILRRLKAGDIQVVVNCAVLTEGFDEPSVSCIILLRPCSDKSVMIQMIGRGLRTLNEKDYPGQVKRDCVVLDFGISLLTHGDISAEIDLDDAEKRDADGHEAPMKKCPVDDGGCGAIVPIQVRGCPLCGFVFPRPEDAKEIAEEVSMTEIDILNRSPFRWVDLFGNGLVMIASGFGCFATVASADGGETWAAMGKPKAAKEVERLYVGDKLPAVSMADDFLRQEEDSSSANKASRWMKDPASEKQAEFLIKVGYLVERDMFGDVRNFSKLTATAHLNFAWNRLSIERALGVAA